MKTTGERKMLKKERHLQGKGNLKQGKSTHGTTERGYREIQREQLGFVLEGGV